MTAYEKFMALTADLSPLSLELCSGEYDYFCRPNGAHPDKIPLRLCKAPLQAEFDYCKIEFGDEYYDVLGIEK